MKAAMLLRATLRAVAGLSATERERVDFLLRRALSEARRAGRDAERAWAASRGTCLAPGCGSPATAKGRCAKHYHRRYRAQRQEAPDGDRPSGRKCPFCNRDLVRNQRGNCGQKPCRQARVAQLTREWRARRRTG